MNLDTFEAFLLITASAVGILIGVGGVVIRTARSHIDTRIEQRLGKIESRLDRIESYMRGSHGDPFDGREES